MAFKKTLAQRLFGISKTTNLAITNCRISSPCSAAKSAILNNRSNINNDSSDDGIFRRYLNTVPKSPSTTTFFPSGEKLSEKIRELSIAKNRVRLDGLIPPTTTAAMPPEEVAAEEGLTVMDVKKVMKVSQLETVKERLRMVEKDCVSYNEFLEICGKDCESVESGLEFAEILDQSGSVIVLGNVVFLKPDKVVKAIQGLMPTPSPLSANDPRIKELEELETQKEGIDKKAELLVRRELWCGLGYLIVQTVAFMRLTFWELTWDVMEPICFYVTSMYFMGGYAFFLRTSKEPSFEGFFQSRFIAKQKRLMKAQNFDLKRYSDLKKACYPQLSATRESSVSFSSPVHDPILRT